MKKYTVLILAFALVFTTLWTTGCSTTEEAQVIDIIGTWNFAFTNNVPTTTVWTITFLGSPTSGTVTDTFPGGSTPGAFSVVNNTITFQMVYAGYATVSYTGTVNSTNHMSGTWTASVGGTGTWLATR